jgi:hypothetical protein
MFCKYTQSDARKKKQREKFGGVRIRFSVYIDFVSLFIG